MIVLHAFTGEMRGEVKPYHLPTLSPEDQMAQDDLTVGSSDGIAESSSRVTTLDDDKKSAEIQKKQNTHANNSNNTNRDTKNHQQQKPNLTSPTLPPSLPTKNATVVPTKIRLPTSPVPTSAIQQQNSRLAMKHRPPQLPNINTRSNKKTVGSSNVVLGNSNACSNSPLPSPLSYLSFPTSLLDEDEDIAMKSVLASPGLPSAGNSATFSSLLGHTPISKKAPDFDSLLTPAGSPEEEEEDGLEPWIQTV